MVFDCKSCGFEWNSAKELEDHEDYEHNFECPQCEETYPTKNQLEVHISNCHNNQCPHCAKIFKGNKTLRKHIKMKHVDDISSKNCQQIQQHDPVTNENFQCAKCEKIFRNKEVLTQHDKKMHKDNESSDDEFDQEMSAGKKKVSTLANAKNIEDYDEDDVYDEDSSSDEDTGLPEKATVENESKDDKSTEEGKESRDIKSLEEEENHLNKLKLRLKMVKAKSTIETALEQGKVSKKNEPPKPFVALVSKEPTENESPKMGKQKQTSLVQSAELVKDGWTERRPVACVKPQLVGKQVEDHLQMGEVGNRQSKQTEEQQQMGENTLDQGKDEEVKEDSKEDELHTTEENVVLAEALEEEEATGKEVKDGSFPCDNCGKSFETEESLVKHIRRNPCGEQSTFTCTNCGKPFNWLASLYRHLKQLNKCDANETGKSGFGCKFCGNKFHDGESLYHHMKRLTSAAKKMEEDSKEKIRRHKCDRCGYTFENINHLSRHKKRCAGDFNLKCNECGHPYLSRFALTRHMKSQSCGPVLEPKARKRTLAKQTNLETREKAWEHHGVGKNQTEMLFVSTSSRVSR